MSNAFFFIVAVLAILDLIVIIALVAEDILYDTSEKLWRIILVLCIPFFGAIAQLYLLYKFYSSSKRSIDESSASNYSDQASVGSDGGGD